MTDENKAHTDMMLCREKESHRHESAREMGRCFIIDLIENREGPEEGDPLS
jgi:hypothetical protein